MPDWTRGSVCCDRCQNAILDSEVRYKTTIETSEEGPTDLYWTGILCEECADLITEPVIKG